MRFIEPSQRVLSRFVVGARLVLIFSLPLLFSACASKSEKPSVVQQTPLVDGMTQTQYQQALQLLKSGENQMSAVILDEIVRLKPDYIGPRVNSGIAYFRLGELDKAYAKFSSVIARYEAPTNSSEEAQENTEANPKSASTQVSPKNKFELNANEKPFLLTAYNYLGVIDRDKGEFDKSEGHYRKALAIDSEHGATMRNLAILLDLYLGRLEEALTFYEKYQAGLSEANAQVKDWIFDLKARLK